MPLTTQAQGWARLLAAVADQVVARTVHDVHRAITDAGFRWVRPIGRPIQQVHDAVVDGVYHLVHAGLRGLGEVGVAVATADPGPEPLSAGALRARAIVAGVVDGDLLAAAPELDVDVSLRNGSGSVVVADVAGLKAAHPDPSGHVVVFVHGLVDSEAVWCPGVTPPSPDAALEGDATPPGTVIAPVGSAPPPPASLPARVRAAGATPLLVRYGTGRPVVRNGVDLAALLEAVVTNWPVPVTRLTLVAHSMGGLVARAACDVAGERGDAWITPLHDVVYLGTPHLGAWLEKVANVLSWSLRRASPQSAPIGTLLDARSRGIKDLRFGSLLEGDAEDFDVDDLLAGLGTGDLPWMDGVTHHLLVGRLRDGGGHPLNVLFGDTMVRLGSATGRGRWRRIPDGGAARVATIAAPHSHLPTHPDVASLLGDVLDGPTAPNRLPATPDTSVN